MNVFLSSPTVAFKTHILPFAKLTNYVNKWISLYGCKFVPVKPLSYPHICQSSLIRISTLIARV